MVSLFLASKNSFVGYFKIAAVMTSRDLQLLVEKFVNEHCNVISSWFVKMNRITQEGTLTNIRSLRSPSILAFSSPLDLLGDVPNQARPLVFYDLEPARRILVPSFLGVHRGNHAAFLRGSLPSTTAIL